MTVAVRDAATVILVRDPHDRPHVLMGQRGTGAAFMPDKVVFPGGRVDPGDSAVPLASPLRPLCHDRLLTPDGPAPTAIAAAAIRELREETGQFLTAPGSMDTVPAGWADFDRNGCLPDPRALAFVFRAITPPGPPRRFDARFFVADAAALATDPDDFSAALDELSNIRWVDLSEACTLDLPFITRAVLGHVVRHLPDLGPHEHVPFFREGDEARAQARAAQGYTA